MGRDSGKQSRPGKYSRVSDSRRKQLALIGQMEQKQKRTQRTVPGREPLDSCCGLSCSSWLGSTPLEEDSHESSVIRNPWADRKGWGRRSGAEKESQQDVLSGRVLWMAVLAWPLRGNLRGRLFLRRSTWRQRGLALRLLTCSHWSGGWGREEVGHYIGPGPSKYSVRVRS